MPSASKSNSLISSTSGRTRWMISATVAAWALSGVDRSEMSCPAKLRLSEALNVANRIAAGGPPEAGAAAIVLDDTAVAPPIVSSAASSNRAERRDLHGANPLARDQRP